MNAFLIAQQGPPQPGWSLQYTLDVKPTAGRTYEPNSLATHTTATNIGLLLRFYRLTGDRRFLARIPEALDWLEGLTLPPGMATAGGRIRRSSSSARTGRCTCTAKARMWSTDDITWTGTRRIPSRTTAPFDASMLPVSGSIRSDGGHAAGRCDQGLASRARGWRRSLGALFCRRSQRPPR